MVKKINLREMMLGLQSQMDAKLSLSRRTLTHPGTIGDFSELEWLTLLSEYLPKRYDVDKGFVVDARGAVSDQIDIIIFDRHYTPFVFHQNGAKYIPAEAVYAVLECKQDITPANIKYAAKKAKSVRSLKRTSSPIVHAGGLMQPKKLHNIIAGLVCVGGAVSASSKKQLETLSPSETLNAICSLSGAYFRLSNFDLWKRNNPPHQSELTQSKLSLVAFVMNLIGDLQGIGTVPAIDIKQYLPRL
jgi:Domain of unknown function (DUF6602)